MVKADSLPPPLLAFKVVVRITLFCAFRPLTVQSFIVPFLTRKKLCLIGQSYTLDTVLTVQVASNGSYRNLWFSLYTFSFTSFYNFEIRFSLNCWKKTLDRKNPSHLYTYSMGPPYLLHLTHHRFISSHRRISPPPLALLQPLPPLLPFHHRRLTTATAAASSAIAVASTVPLHFSRRWQGLCQRASHPFGQRRAG